MTVISSVFNNKGGVSKSTNNMNIAMHLAMEGKKVLLIDVDSQSNLTSRIYKEEHNNYTIGDSIISNNQLTMKDIILSDITDYENLYFIPSNENMSYLEEILAKSEDKEVIIMKWLVQNKETVDLFDYILWDIGPNVGIVGRNVLITCSNIMFVNDYGCKDSLKMIHKFIEKYEEHSKSIGFDMCKYIIFNNKTNKKMDAKTKEEYEAILNKYEYLKEHFLNVGLIESSVIKRANTEKISIKDYIKKHKVNNVADLSFDALINELKERGIL